MSLCLQAAINDEPAVVAEGSDVKVLTAMVTFVPAQSDLTFDVSAMLENSDHVKWLAAA